jgi:hypothetical protein
LDSAIFKFNSWGKTMRELMVLSIIPTEPNVLISEVTVQGSRLCCHSVDFFYNREVICKHAGVK